MNKIDLSGKWNFLLDIEKKGIDEQFYNKKDFTDSINLPGTVSQQKKSPELNIQTSTDLVDFHKYQGWAWFNKSLDLEPSNANLRLTLERTKFSTLWINGKKIGSNTCLNGKHKYDFSLNEAYSNPIDITILVSNENLIFQDEEKDLQSNPQNWNGIIGDISLEEIQKDRLENTKIFATNKELKITTDFTGKNSVNCKFFIENILDKTVQLNSGHNEITFSDLKNFKLWSDSKPAPMIWKSVLIT